MFIVKMFKSIINIINDPKRSFSERVFIMLTFISSIAVDLAFLGDIIIGESIFEILVMIFTVFFVPTATFLGVKFNRVDIAAKLIVLGLVFFDMPAIFFFGGGVEGGAIIWFIFAFLYIGLVMTGKWRTVMFSFMMLISTACYFINYYYPELIYQHTKKEFYLDSYFGLLLVGIVCFVMVIFQNRLFWQENKIAKREAERAEELNRSQNRFFSSMSHEIRTPINSILGLNELILRDENVSDEIVKDAGGIAGAGKMLLALINDILDFSKIEAGSMDIVPVDYRIGDLLSEVVNMIWMRAQEKDLKFEVSVDPSVPSVLYGDEVRIKQILINLLNNAVKYTKEGSVGLHIESEEIGDNKVVLRISVSDTGMGIKSDSIPYLFDAFKRVDEQKNRYIEGTGLGLSIVKQLVDLQKGEISVNSVYGEGTTFNVVLQQGISDSSKIGELNIKNFGTVKRSTHESAFTAPEAKVLIVDDNEMNLIVEKRLLTGTMMTIDTAVSGKQALEMMLKVKYDVIFMDHLMPEMDGVECLEKLRNQDGGLNNSTPVIALTANAGSDNIDLYKRSGFDGYLLKPVSGESLENILMQHIQAEKMIIKDQAQRMNKEQNTLSRYARKTPFAICTSTMCDLPDALMNDPRIHILPFVVKTEEGVFKDYYQMDTDELVHYLESGRNAVSSPADVTDYVEFFAANLKKAHHLVYIAISTSMSTDYEKAVEAAKSFDNVTVINAECLSSAAGILVMIACKLVQQDITPEDLKKELESVRSRLKCSFVIDTTKFMVKKGLISAGFGAIATSMDIHPSLGFKDDKAGLFGLWIGKKKHAYQKYIQKSLKSGKTPESDIVFITYVGVPEDMLLWIRDEIKKYVNFERVIFQKASAAIASNCGPGSFGILFIEKGKKSYNLSSLLPAEAVLNKTEEDNIYFEEDDNTDDEDIIIADRDEPGDEKEREKLWYEEIPGIDGDAAIRNSGSEDALKTVIKLFYDSIDEKTAELKGFYDSENWTDYTIKAHALKSSAKLIGAIPLSDEALNLEMAGKNNDTDYIKNNHDTFMAHYAEYKDNLRAVCGGDENDGDSPGSNKPVADKYLMETVYEALGDGAAEMDCDLIEDTLKELEEYSIPDEEKDKFNALCEKAKNFDYEGILEILGRK